MASLLIEEPSHFDSLIEMFAFIREKYGDNYPIILYEPSINCQEKKDLKDLIQGNSSIHVFAELKEAFKFVQYLGTSFILIVSESKLMDEKTVLQNFASNLEKTYGRSMLDFEEEAFLKDLFQGISDDKIKILKLKVYVFITLLDFMSEAPAKEDEEEVMIIPSVKEMAEKFRQEYNVIWFDPCLCLTDKEALKQKFDIEERNFYHNFEELEERIKNSGDSPFHLILTGKDEAERIVNKVKISPLKESLLGLYIYSNDPEVIKFKNRNIFVENTLEELIPKITGGIRAKSKLTNSFPAFTTAFNHIDKSKNYSLHYYLRGLINFKNRKQAQRDFLQLVKMIYESKKIFEFEQDYDEYNKEKIFKWYAMESPVYKLVNNCLRIATSDSILYCRFILGDLERAIREEYQEKSHQFNGAVYRGAYISQGEWEELRGNVGKEIEMYGFLSTSENIATAKNFVCSDLRNKVLITIIVPLLPAPELNDQGFAKIDQDSGFQEAEILFNVRSKFRIVEAGVTKINSQGKECRHLVLLYGAQLLRKYMTKHQPTIAVNFKLPSEKKCGRCGSAIRLFAFHQDTTEVRCIDCLTQVQVPSDIPLLDLDFQKNSGGNEVIMKSFKGKLLTYNQTNAFPFYGYRCESCQESGKEKYYKWVALNEQKTYEQCSECFLKGTKIKAEILLSESNPYVLWQENETKLEAIESDYQADFSQELKSKSQGYVYLEAQNFNLCIKYEKEVLIKLNQKRRRERKKLESLEMLGKAEQSLGNYREAFGYYQRCLDIITSFYGKGELQIKTTIYSNMASLYQDMKEHEKAMEYGQKDLQINQIFYGKEHPYVATSYHNLAFVSHQLGKHQQALELFQKGLDIMKACSKENHPDTAKIYHGLASVYDDLREYQQAIDYHQKALDIKEAIFGEKHVETTESYNNMAITYEKSGKSQQALEYHLKALNIKKEILGEKHAVTANSYNNVGNAYQGLGEYTQAITCHYLALNIRKEIFGEKHEKTADSYSSLARVEKEIGNNQQALEYHNKALDIRKHIFGEIDARTAESYFSVASIYQDLGENRKALEYYNKLLSIRKNIFGESHQKTAVSYHYVGVMYHHLHEYGKALENHKKALSIRKKVLKGDHSEIASSYSSMGLAYLDHGNPQKAVIKLQKGRSINEVAYGQNHLETAHIYGGLALAYESLEKYECAMKFCKKALDVYETGDEKLQKRIKLMSDLKNHLLKYVLSKD